MKSSGFRLTLSILQLVGVCVLFSCSKDAPTVSYYDGQASEVAVSGLSGAVASSDTSSGAARAFARPEGFDSRYSVSCSGFSFTACASNVTTFMPPDCTVDFGGGVTVTSDWSGGPFTFTIGGAGGTCNCAGANSGILKLDNGCTFAVTLGATGITRTITGPRGNKYSISANTAAPKGWDSSVTVAAGGNVMTCTGTKCENTRSIVMNGTQLSGTVDSNPFWDHTVSTDPMAPLVVNGTGAARTVEVGAKVITQLNYLHVTATTEITTQFTHSAGCCFPTGGAVKTTFKGGANDGKFETATFGPACGATKIVTPAGNTVDLTLTHCI